MSNNKVGPFLPQGFPLPNHALPSKDRDLAPRRLLSKGETGWWAPVLGHDAPSATEQKLLPPGPAAAPCTQRGCWGDARDVGLPRRVSPSQTMPWHTETQSSWRGDLAAGLQRGDPTREAAAPGPGRSQGGLSESPKCCCCVPPSPGAAADGWVGARPLVQGRELGWEGAFVALPTAPRPPQPPPSSRGEMSSGGSDSGSCHCCPWERGRGRDAPLFSPGAAEPRACEAAPWGATSPAGCAG